jgi:1-deoxy-D-xylulose-5-phosphate synthase
MREARAWSLSQEFPERYFDVGICRAACGDLLAAGLLCEGLQAGRRDLSTFLQRAYDQLIHDVVLQDLDVLFAIDRAGLVGADGPTHAGSFDLTYLRCLPNIVVMAPSDENECRQMLYTGFVCGAPAAVRYPRGRSRREDRGEDDGIADRPRGDPSESTSGKVAILAFGSMVHPALAAAEALDADGRQHALRQADRRGADHRYGEPASIPGDGRGEHDPGRPGRRSPKCSRHAASRFPLLMLGLPGPLHRSWRPALLLKLAGLDAGGIAQSIRTRFGLTLNVARGLKKSGGPV